VKLYIVKVSISDHLSRLRNCHAMCKLPHVSAQPGLNANCPAIKGVSVAERMQAGAVKLSRGRVLVPAGRSEAWRGFCRQVASFLSFTSVAV
jgi:hypothetical protein